MDDDEKQEIYRALEISKETSILHHIITANKNSKQIERHLNVIYNKISRLDQHLYFTETINSLERNFKYTQ